MELPYPFHTIDQTFGLAFAGFLGDLLGQVESVIAVPVLLCVTLWIIVQGMLVMRGDIDARHGVIRIVLVAIIVGLATSESLYTTYVQTLFVTTIPNLVPQLGNFGVPAQGIPYELDAVFRAGEAMFQRIAARIPEADTQDVIAFEGAQAFFYFSLWSIFSIYDVVSILTTVLVDVGPLLLILYLFENTKAMVTRWIGQLVTYGLLLILLSIVAAIVVSTESLAVVAAFAADQLLLPPAAQILGLYELDMFFLTGNALVVALPAIAAFIGGGVGTDGAQWASSFGRRFRNAPSAQTMQQMGTLR